MLESLSKIFEGSLPLLSRPVDLETVKRNERSQELYKAPGADEIPRELYKYGMHPLLVLLWREIIEQLSLSWNSGQVP